MSNNGYPFVTKNEVSQKIASEPAFVLECVRLVDERQGWMASHRTRAGKVLSKITAGNLSAEDLAEAVALIAPYARTISRVLREKKMAERPELAVQAAVFGIVRPAAMVAEAPPVDVAPATGTTATEIPIVMPKRRGRPPGSKNKKLRSEPEQPRRRRRS